MLKAPVGYRNGIWLPSDQLNWEIDDLGTMYGAIAVERLRTIGGRLLTSEWCFHRFHETCKVLGCNIVLEMGDWSQRLQQLLAENRRWLHDEGDASLVVVASPGRRGKDQSNFMMYMEQLPVDILSDRYACGVPLVLSSVRNVPSSCWPVQIKTRSRLHYYLADRESQLIDPKAIALLLNQADQVADTSIACVLIEIDGNWCTPSLDYVLPSTTLMLLDSACRQTLDVQRRSIHVGELSRANEVLLLGSTGLVQAASSVDFRHYGGGRQVLKGTVGEGYQRLLQACFVELEFDFVKGQALSKAIAGKLNES